MGLSVGLPRMSGHPGERRDFLPRLVRSLPNLGADEVVIEEAYGSGMDLVAADYVAERVRVASREEVLGQDVVLILRCPHDEDLRRLKPGAILVSMLHYPTRPPRNDLLRDLGVVGVSLDAITDDRGRRMIENLELTAWAGVASAFRELALGWGWFAVPGRQPIRVTVLGSGALGAHAMHAATRYGEHETRDALHRAGVPGVEVAVVDHDLSWHEGYMVERLRSTDILVDATLRRDPSVAVVPNAWLGVTPSHAVLLDLAADPYDFGLDPPSVKGIGGVPHGTLARYVFPARDPAWDELGPSVDTRVRRVALSCDAWPGVRPQQSMERYGEQIEEVMDVVLGVPEPRWDRKDAHHRVRAVARAELDRWTKAHHDR
jgi:alanine dehydrogenase